MSVIQNLDNATANIKNELKYYRREVRSALVELQKQEYRETKVTLELLLKQIEKELS